MRTGEGVPNTREDAMHKRFPIPHESGAGLLTILIFLDRDTDRNTFWKTGPQY